jgi:methylenetetrahydrofolate reductase (NADPH)
VRSMIEYLRRFSEEYQGHAGGFRAGVTTRLQPLPSWKQEADFLFVQVSFDLEQLLAWRDTVEFDGNVYAGVMVLPSASMARKLAADLPEITVPGPWIEAVEQDRSAGVDLACELAHRIAESGAFDGVHLIPGVRYRETASRLES